MRLLAGGGLGAVAAVSGVARHSGPLRRRPLFSPPELPRAPVPVGVGVLLVRGGHRRRGAASRSPTRSTTALRRPIRAASVVLLVALGFCLLGLLDDLAGSGDDRGFTRPPAGDGPGPAHHRRPEAASAAGSWRVVVAPASCRRHRPRNLVVDAAAHRAGRQPGQPVRPGAGPHASRSACSPWCRSSCSPPPATARQLTGVAVVLGAAAGPAAVRPPGAADARRRRRQRDRRRRSPRRRADHAASPPDVASWSSSVAGSTWPASGCRSAG